MQVYRQKSRMPVVAMKDVGGNVEIFAAVDQCPTEENVSQQRIIEAGAGAVDLIAVVEVVVADENQRNVGAGQRRAEI
jgi:hypothetical protein